MPISWRLICYIAVRSPTRSACTPANHTIVGYCLRHSAEQQGSLKFLAQVEKVLGWRTSWMMRELEEQWTELAAVDSWSPQS